MDLERGGLPAPPRLFPKLNTVAVVGGAPKAPMLKLTAAGLVFNPNPPKLNPPAVVLTAPKPPNPDRTESHEEKERERENKRCVS